MTSNILPMPPPSQPDHRFNADLRERFLSWKRETGLTNRRIADMLGSNESQISRYCTAQPNGDVAALEARIEDALQNAETRRLAWDGELVENYVAKLFKSCAEQVRAVNGIGAFVGHAGLGKTSAIDLYLKSQPTAVAIEVNTVGGRGSGALERALFRAVDGSGWLRNTSRADWLVERLAKSDRLLIVDNAHQLSVTGKQWLFDFRDATQLGVLLVGNPRLLDSIDKDPQQFRRLGCVHIVETDRTRRPSRHARQVKPGVLAETADAVMRRIFPDPEQFKAVRDLGHQVALAENCGHLGALKEQCLLAMQLVKKKSCKGNARTAFLTAHTQLRRPYDLEA